ncbi:hypothetical protein A9Q96_14000 [Rhodobacterales bacterium 52_120_T64]|nr:hypothetical protein A9Q96_14000 [Rhodobacterales bacterium 52_120_T64]
MSVEHIQNSVNDVITYLNENPKDALSNDPPVTAVMENGLRCRATGTGGESIVTDMPEAIGGGGSAPSPGWLSRAALATCDATRIALHAAHVGVTLDTLTVTIDSVSDDRGLLGLDDSVPAGPLSVQTQITIGAAGVDENVLREIVDFSVAHSPVSDGCRRATPTNINVEIA